MIGKIVLGLVLGALLGQTGCALFRPNALGKDSSGSKTYCCHFASAPITIDGRLDEPAWAQAPTVEFFLPESGKPAQSPTRGKILWDREYLYVSFEAVDKDVWSYFTTRDCTTCHEDVLEIFLKPDLSQEPYFNFEINAVGTVYDAYNLKRNAGGGDHHRWSRWNCPGLKVAVSVQGTLNDPGDVDEGWRMEVAIPWSGLPALKDRRPRAGDIWRFHLARYDYSVYLPKGVELTSCAPLTKVDFHRYEDWMRLEFVTSRDSTPAAK